MIHRQQAAQKLCLQGFAKIIIADDVYKKNLQVDIKAARSAQLAKVSIINTGIEIAIHTF